MICQQLFATPVWTSNLSDTMPDLNSMLIMDGESYSAQSRQQQLPNYSDTIFNYSFLDFPGYGTQLLKQQVMNTVSDIAQQQQWPEHTVELRSLQNFIQPGECDSPHHHPDCDLVAVYYVKVPDCSGDLLLNDTRGSVKALWQDPAVKTDANGKSGRVFYRVKPQPGLLIMFPNYVFHSVETNLSQESRISVVMNIRINVREQYGTY
jgi:uncharacterized protein (TIGR02466 family)